MSTAAEVIQKTSGIAAYNEFRSQLAELKANNSKLVFNYEDPKGNKEARSHIYKLRQTKAAVDKVRAKEKAESLEYGRRVDAEAKEIICELEAMIDVHQKPLDQIEQREKDRIAAHQRKLDELQAILDTDYGEESAPALRRGLDNLCGLEPDESMEEFTGSALAVWKRAKDKMVKALVAREKYDAEQAELLRLRQESEERARKEREEQIRREAEERAKAAAEAKAKEEQRRAEEKAKAEREAAERRELELKLAKERAEKEKAEAEQRAERAAKEAEERVRREAEEARRREEAEAAKREANKKHRAKINNAAVAAFVEGGMTQEAAKLAVTLIASQKIPAVTISY